MAVYEYRCGEHDVFALTAPLGQAPATAACPVCDQQAARIYSPPMVRRAPANRVALIDKAEKSRHEPDVVTSLPPRPPHKRTPMAPPNPALQRLPRP